MLAGLLALQGGALGGAEATEIPDAITITRTSAEIGQGVHVKLDPDKLQPLADDAGVSLYDFRREAEYLWTFDEDYTFPDLGARHNGPKTSGKAGGPFAAHVYKASGSYTITCLWYFRGSVWRSTIDVTISDTSFTSAETGVVDPDGDWSGFPAHATANRFTDFDAAARAWQTDQFRHLVLRGGKTYEVGGHKDQPFALDGGKAFDYTPPADGARVSTIGSGRAVLNINTGDGSVEVFKWLLKERGDGSQTDFVHDAALPANLAVYVGTTLQAETADYTIETTTVTDDTVRFTTAPANDEPVYLIDAAADGALPQGKHRVFRVGRDDVSISGLDVRGGYDPADPGVFDPADLATFEHDVIVSGVATDGALANLTIFDCSFSGLREGLANTPRGEDIFVVGCNIDNWYNYGIFSGSQFRQCVVGCSIRQKENALNGPGSKSENKVGVANHPDHGPIRVPQVYDSVFNRLIMESRNGWGANNIGDTNAQPCLRAPQSNTPLMSFCLTESTTLNGQVTAAGVPNPWHAVPKADLSYLAYNVHIGGTGTGSFHSGQFPISSINSVYYLPDAPVDDNFEIAQITTTGNTQSQDGVREVGHLFLNCTIIIKADRPTRNLTLGGPREITPTGIVNEVGRATVSGTPTSVDVVTDLNGGINNGNEHAWRVWRRSSAEADSDATAQATVTARDAVYTLSEPDANPAIDPTVTVTLVSGSFAAGDVVILTREHTEETPEIELVGGVPTYTGGTLPRETFFPNNLTADIGLAEPAFDNCLIGVDGDWSTFKVLDSGSAETLSNWRTSRFAPISSLFQPQSGSTALGVAVANFSVAASGGTQTTITEGSDDYTVHEFTADGTFTVTEGGEIEYLIVGGGGGGSTAGGGAGGVVQGTMTITPGSYPVVVGDGGDGVPDLKPRPIPADPGEDSSFNGLVALGGGPGSGTDFGATPPATTPMVARAAAAGRAVGPQTTSRSSAVPCNPARPRAGSAMTAAR